MRNGYTSSLWNVDLWERHVIDDDEDDDDEVFFVVAFVCEDDMFVLYCSGGANEDLVFCLMLTE